MTHSDGHRYCEDCGHDWRDHRGEDGTDFHCRVDGCDCTGFLEDEG